MVSIIVSQGGEGKTRLLQGVPSVRFNSTFIGNNQANEYQINGSFNEVVRGLGFPFTSYLGKPALPQGRNEFIKIGQGTIVNASPEVVINELRASGAVLGGNTIAQSEAMAQSFRSNELFRSNLGAQLRPFRESVLSGRRVTSAEELERINSIGNAGSALASLKLASGQNISQNELQSLKNAGMFNNTFTQTQTFTGNRQGDNANIGILALLAVGALALSN